MHKINSNCLGQRIAANFRAGYASWITSGSLLIIKVHWYQIIWLITILAFRYRLRLSLQRIVPSYGLGVLFKHTRRPTKNLTPLDSSQSGKRIFP